MGMVMTWILGLGLGLGTKEYLGLKLLGMELATTDIFSGAGVW
jgi:hypothetical protein